MADPAQKQRRAISSINEPRPGAGQRVLARAVARALSCACVALVLLLGVVHTEALAQQEPALRVLVLEGPGAEWLRRVRGQLSDLPVAIVTLPLVVQGQAEADVLRQLGPLATNRDAALVAWLMTDGTRYDASASEDTFVAIWFARSGRLFTRRLGARWRQLSRADRSGVLEIGALSVRSAVRSLLLDPDATPPLEPDVDVPGGASALGAAAAQSRAAAQGAARAAERTARDADAAAAASATARQQPAPPSAGATTGAEPLAESSNAGPREPPEAALPPPLAPDEGHIVASPRVELEPTPTPAADRGAAGAAEAGRSLSLDWSAELGLSGQLAGPPGYAAAGIAGGVHVASGRWGLGVLGRFGLPLRSELGPSELELQHHALLLEAQYRGLDWGALTLSPLVRGGLALSRRETVSGPANLAAAGVLWSRAAQLGAGASVRYRWGTHWGASLRGVLHWLPARTDYALVDDLGDPIASAQPWAVQPSLELSMSWHF